MSEEGTRFEWAPPPTPLSNRGIPEQEQGGPVDVIGKSKRSDRKGAARRGGRVDAPEPHLAEAVERLQVVNDQLETALESRIVIEQAKGILAERYALTMDDAFALLRQAARRNRSSLRVLARAVVSSPDFTPEPILAMLARAERGGGTKPG